MGFCSLQIKYSVVTYDTTFENYTMLTGNVVSLGMGGLICMITSLIFPEDYDFVSMKQIRLLDDNVDSDMGFTKVGLSPPLPPHAPVPPPPPPPTHTYTGLLECCEHSHQVCVCCGQVVTFNMGLRLHNM